MSTGSLKLIYSITHTGPFDFVNKLLKNSDGVDLVGEVGVVDCGFDTASERRVLGRVRNWAEEEEEAEVEEGLMRSVPRISSSKNCSSVGKTTGNSVRT